MNEPHVTRRSFLKVPATAAVLAGAAPFLLPAQSPNGAAAPPAGGAQNDVVIERDLPGKPYAGKVLAAIGTCIRQTHRHGAIVTSRG